MSATACVTVGYANNTTGAQIPFAESFNGTGWRVQSMPVGPNGNDLPDAIACASASSCVAVGTFEQSASAYDGMAEDWNGSSWAWVNVPPPGGPYSSDANLAGVSCPGVNDCVAVGYYRDASSNVAMAAAEIWNGSSWTVVNPPSPSGAIYGTQLSAISCTSPSSCTAVGFYGDQAGSGQALVETWDGSQWTIRSAAGSLNAAFHGISCLSSGWCVAVGTGPGGPLAESSQDGGLSWSLMSLPSSNSTLAAVSCSSNSSCVATGSTYNGSANAPFALSWTGSAWAATTVPDPALKNMNDPLTGVACPALNQCIASGWTAWGASYRTLAETWTGSGWSIDPTPNPAGTLGSWLSGVACPGATQCVAVGAYTKVVQTAERTATLVEAWNGKAWSIQRSPNPSASAGTSLTRVACMSSVSCMAVGSYYNAAQTQLTLAEYWNGSAWSIQTPPNAASGPYDTNNLIGVACPAAGECLAVGYDSGSTPTQSLAELWNGSSWSVLSTPGVSGSTTELSGISCGSTTSCMAVGYSLKSANDTSPLVELWDGVQWTILSTPSPQGGDPATLSAVSCSSASACTVVGTDNATNSAFSELWNGTAWSISSAPLPSGGLGSTLAAVNCSSSASCNAAGTYYTSNNNLPLGELWSGTSWAAQPMPSAPGSGDNTLTALACPATSQCFAVGFYQSTGTLQVPLVEHYS